MLTPGYRHAISHHNATCRVESQASGAARHNPLHVRRKLTDDDYRRLLDLRTGLRRFLHWSERQAQKAGLTPAQHQLLLAVRGHDHRRGPTVGDVAGYLMLRHHSAVGLVDRAEAAGLLVRSADPDRPGTVRLRLTTEGARRLEALSELHVEELAHLSPTLHALWEALERANDGDASGARHPAAPPQNANRPAAGEPVE
jgi:DNA-binding MarR family transcriptional regulator